MPDSAGLNIQIAAVNFSVMCGTQATFSPLPSAYSQFLKPTDEPVDSIRLQLELNDPPDTGTMTRIFDSGSSWALFLQGGDYFIEYRPPAFCSPFWVARVDIAMQKATVHSKRTPGSENDKVPALVHPLFYPLDQILLMHILARRDGALIHASGGVLQGKGFLFPGRSGAGKSTLSRILSGHNRMDMLSDDRIAVRKIGDSYKIFGTPWPGDAGIAENRNCSLAGIFFLRHSDDNGIADIKPVEAMERLMAVTSIPWYDRETLPAVLDFCEGLVSSVPAYELCFRPDGEVVELLEKFVPS